MVTFVAKGSSDVKSNTSTQRGPIMLDASGGQTTPHVTNESDSCQPGNNINGLADRVDDAEQYAPFYVGSSLATTKIIYSMVFLFALCCPWNYTHEKVLSQVAKIEKASW